MENSTQAAHDELTRRFHFLPPLGPSFVLDFLGFAHRHAQTHKPFISFTFSFHPETHTILQWTNTEQQQHQQQTPSHNDQDGHSFPSRVGSGSQETQGRCQTVETPKNSRRRWETTTAGQGHDPKGLDKNNNDAAYQAKSNVSVWTCHGASSLSESGKVFDTDNCRAGISRFEPTDP